MAEKDNKKSGKWGYGKTDPDTHWKKGCPSPNPKGRPKGSKNQKSIWQNVGKIEVDVQIDGKNAKMSKKEVKYHQLSDKAASGDLKAIGMANELDAKFDPIETIPPTPEESAADFQTLEEWHHLLEKFQVFKASDAKPAAKDNAPHSNDIDHG